MLGADILLVKLHACDRFTGHRLQGLAFLLLSLQEVLGQSEALDFNLLHCVWILLYAVVESLLWFIIMLFQVVCYQNMSRQ